MTNRNAFLLIFQQMISFYTRSSAAVDQAAPLKPVLICTCYGSGSGMLDFKKKIIVVVV